MMLCDVCWSRENICCGWSGWDGHFSKGSAWCVKHCKQKHNQKKKETKKDEKTRCSTDDRETM